MLHVELDNILTEDQITTQIHDVLQRADENKELFVVTRAGHPAVAVLNLQMLEDLSGRTVHSEGVPLTPAKEDVVAENPIVEPVAETPATPIEETAPQPSLPDMPA